MASGFASGEAQDSETAKKVKKIYGEIINTRRWRYMCACAVDFVPGHIVVEFSTR